MSRTVEFADPTLQAGFTQIPNAILRDSSLSAGARLTYAMLESFAWQDDECWPGQTRLGELVGVKERAIHNYLKELVAANLLKIKRQGLHKPNRYVLFGAGPDRHVHADQDQHERADEEDTEEEDSEKKGSAQKEVRPRVGGKLVTEEEGTLATSIITAFNEKAGTSLSVRPHLTPIVGRIRERPNLTAAQHEKIIAAVFAGEHWWSDPPGPRIIYGNAAQFEQSIELARKAHKSSTKSVDVNARRKAVRKRQGLE